VYLHLNTLAPLTHVQLTTLLQRPTHAELGYLQQPLEPTRAHLPVATTRAIANGWAIVQSQLVQVQTHLLESAGKGSWCVPAASMPAPPSACATDHSIEKYGNPSRAGVLAAATSTKPLMLFQQQFQTVWMRCKHT